MAISVKTPSEEPTTEVAVEETVATEQVVVEEAVEPTPEPTPAPEPTPEPTPTPKATSVNLGPVTLKDKAPCNWFIVEVEEGMIEARNTNTGEVFTGNIEDFNTSLRG